MRDTFVVPLASFLLLLATTITTFIQIKHSHLGHLYIYIFFESLASRCAIFLNYLNSHAFCIILIHFAIQSPIHFAT